MISIGHLSKFAVPNYLTKVNLVTLLLMFFCLSIPNSAKAVQSLTEISKKSTQFLRNRLINKGINSENLIIKVTSPDKRLRLAKCNEPIDYFKPVQSSLIGNTTVGVRCNSPKWQIFLPAKITQLADVWVITQSVRRGDLISEDMIRLEKRPMRANEMPVPKAFNKFQGVRATRNVRAGYTLNLRDICLICKGDKIELQVNNQGLKVKMYGTSMSNGILGDQVSARNSASKKTVTGKVKAAGVLEMSL
ncbi:MAG TPA: flagellar basal body P-ring formation protein FlgA [Aeromonadales bacterium]|nr:flagellar basal body P-ring formation protein FlgA [Aeromonadales bacterium]